MMLSLQELEKQAAGSWAIEPLPDGRSYQVGNGPAYLIFSIDEHDHLQVSSLRKNESAAVEKKSALAHFKGAIDPEGRVRDGIRDLRRIDIKDRAQIRRRKRILERIKKSLRSSSIRAPSG
jgi:hypothetical protein